MLRDFEAKIQHSCRFNPTVDLSQLKIELLEFTRDDNSLEDLTGKIVKKLLGHQKVSCKGHWQLKVGQSLPVDMILL